MSNKEMTNGQKALATPLVLFHSTHLDFYN